MREAPDWVRRLAKRLGYDLVERRFHSPVPDLEALPDDIFDRTTSLAGIDLDVSAQVGWAERELRGFIAECDPPWPFRWHNFYYDTGDAEIAYAVVRHLRPARVVELGSGFSTLVLAHACSLNRGEGSPCELRNFDPYPGELVRDGIPGLDGHRAVSAQEVPLEEFDRLGAGDLLFVDTSHTVKLGGDVNFVVLEVLPRLAPGVWVHFHDIWLPYEYHRVLVEHMKMYWAEQYLLQAFLSGNRDWEVVFATRAVAVAQPERLASLIPNYTGETFPSSFWIRRKP